MLRENIYLNKTYKAIDPEEMVEFIEEMSGKKEGAGSYIQLVDLFTNYNFVCNHLNLKDECATLIPEGQPYSDACTLVIDFDDMVRLFDLAPAEIDFESLKCEMDKYVDKFIYSNTATVCILNTGEKGVARLKSGDTYNKEIGEAVSYYKAKYKKIKNRIRDNQRRCEWAENHVEQWLKFIDKVEMETDDLCDISSEIFQKIKSI